MSAANFAATFAERGALVLDRLFGPALIAAAHDEYLAQFGAMEWDSLPAHLKVGERRVQVPIEIKGALADPALTAHPLLVKIVEGILGEAPIIDSISCVVAFPGAREQDLHRDHREIDPGASAAGRTPPCFAVSVAVPLVDLDAETGATRVFPGTHALPRAPVDKDPEAGVSEMLFLERGGCYLMDYRVWHQGTANRSGRPRPVLFLVYTRPWFTDVVNLRDHARIRIGKETAMAMPAHQRTLFRRLAQMGAIDCTEWEFLA